MLAILLVRQSQPETKTNYNPGYAQIACALEMLVHFVKSECFAPALKLPIVLYSLVDFG